MVSKNELERENSQDCLKRVRDQTAFIGEARAEAGKEGFMEGRKEGWRDRIRVFQGLLRVAVTPKEELSRMSIEDLETLASGLENQLRARYS